MKRDLHVLVTHIDSHRRADTIAPMGSDLVAAAFANWVEAHKKHVEAQKRLGTAEKVARSMGMLPPNELVREVQRLKAEADGLLALAEKAMRASGRP
jgi:hypothetical protein